MSKIRHLAIKTKSPERLAKFYEQVFDMKVILTEKSGAIYMSDGYLTLVIARGPALDQNGLRDCLMRKFLYRSASDSTFEYSS